jgi:hypothetical protein
MIHVFTKSRSLFKKCSRHDKQKSNAQKIWIDITGASEESKDHAILRKLTYLVFLKTLSFRNIYKLKYLLSYPIIELWKLFFDD